MANNFTIDSNCVALYRLENGALTTDSIGGNTLTNHGATSETGDYQEGSGCADFELDSSQYLTIDDADLDSGFPIKSGSSETAISVCMWVKFESVTAWHNLFSKFDPGANQKTFCINVDTTPAIKLNIGYSGGTSHETYTHGSTLTTGRWYHVGVTYDFTSKDYLIRIWDDTAGSIVGTDLDSTGTNSISITSSTLAIGARESAGDNYHDGLLDEIVVFKDILSPDEIDKIRQGIYGYQAFHVSDGEGGYEAFNVSDGGYEAFNVSGLETSLTAEAGAISITGQDASLLFDRVISAGAGSFTLTGQDVNLNQNYGILIDSGTYILTGQDISFLYDRSFDVDPGSFALTGQAASLLFDRAIDAGLGSFALTGQDVSLIYAGSYSITIDSGSFTISGQSAYLYKIYKISSEAGSIAITGQSVNLLRDSEINAEVGTIAITGQDVSLVYGMSGNNFSNDSDCVALYRLENGALTTDSIGGNTLTNNGVASNTTDYKQGGGCGEFVRTESDTLDIADGDLDSDFPFKYSGSEVEISICAWVKFDSLTVNQMLCAKGNDYGSNESFGLGQKDAAIRFRTTGTSHFHGSTIVTGRWYHIGGRFSHTTGDVDIRIWDDTAQAILGTDLHETGASSTKYESDFVLGGYDTNYYLDGLLDEVVIFKRVLTASEVDEIRQGIYGANELSADSGSYSITGTSANLKKTSKIPIEAESFIITGQTTNLLRLYEIIPEAGSIAVTGQDVTLTFAGNYSLTVEAGSIVITGQDVGLIYIGNYEITAEAGSYAITGQDVTLTYVITYEINAESGTFSISGKSAALYGSAGTFNGEFINQLEAETATVVICVALTIDETTYYWCDGTIPIYLDSNKYLPKGINLDSIEAETGMSMKRCQISIPNADGIIGSLVMSNDIREEQFILYWAALNEIGEIVASGNGYGEFFRGVIDDWDNDYSKDTVILRGVDELIYWQAKTLLTSDATCPWPFKGTRCGYSGSATYCDQTYELCKIYGNTDNFGGDLYLPEIMEKQLWWGKGKV